MQRIKDLIEWAERVWKACYAMEPEKTPEPGTVISRVRVTAPLLWGEENTEFVDFVRREGSVLGWKVGVGPLGGPLIYGYGRTIQEAAVAATDKVRGRSMV